MEHGSILKIQGLQHKNANLTLSLPVTIIRLVDMNPVEKFNQHQNAKKNVKPQILTLKLIFILEKWFILFHHVFQIFRLKY